MKFETPTVHAGEEVLAQPRNENCQRGKTEHEERNQENTPVLERCLQQPAITHTESLESCFKTFLNSYQGVAAWGGSLPFFFFSAQQVLCHRRDDRSGEQIRCQHGENHCFGERHKKVTRHARQQEHRSKNNTDRKRGYESGCGDL